MKAAFRFPAHNRIDATPGQLAKFGHIAARIRAFMDKRGLSARQFADAVGSRNNSAVYNWLNAKNAPSGEIAGRMAKLMGITVEQLFAAPGGSGWQEHLEKPDELQDELQDDVQDDSVPAIRIEPPHAPASTVLQFGARSDGMARIQLDVILPLERATPLLRMLLDAGLVVGPPAEA